MKDSDSRYWLIPLLAAFAIYVPYSSVPSTPDQQSSAQPQSPAVIQMPPLATPAPARRQDQVAGEGAKLLCDYLGAKLNSDQDVRGRNSDRKQAQPNALQDFDPKNRRGDYCRVKSFLDSNGGGHPAPDKYAVEYLIATVPDPKDSRFDHMFDRYLDAIQRAIGEADYSFDRYWLPWDRSRTATLVVLPADSNTPQMPMPTRQLYEPGVILFRNNNGGNKLLLLFLVGETPTGGIHKVAFQNALSQIANLAGWIKPKTKKELRIISPCFSGSDASLATLLKELIREHEHVEVRIVSGGAIAVDKDLLEKTSPEKKVSFQSTLVEWKRAEGEFYAYLRELNPWIDRSDDVPQVASLSEAGTATGQRVREGNGNENQPADCAPTPLPVLSLTFPLHISQLRIEAAKLSLQRDEMARAKALGAKAPDLALPMREAGSPTSKDIIPLFSPVETVTMDLTLDEALSAIRRERIRYVGVTASDVQDRIFLVREIRKQCPNAMIFIHSNDLLYLHSESNPDFLGALTISPYPLFGLNQLWTYPFDGYKRRLQFSIPGAEGIYNATLAVLNKEERMLEYGCPLREYRGGEDRYPALWLGIVGRNGIWPVKTFDMGNLKITEQSWKSLKQSPKSRDFPPEVLEKLRCIIDQKFNGEQQFLDKLNKVIGGSQTDEFKELLLQHARNSYTLAVNHNEDGKKKNRHLGLSGNYRSPTGLGILLLIAFIYVFLPLVFLMQLILFWGRGKVDKANPDQWRERRFCLSKLIIRLSLEVEREIKKKKVKVWLRPFVWVRRGRPGQVFGDEDFYRYRLERRINLMSCCFSLTTIALFIASVAILPAWIRREMMFGMMKVSSPANVLRAQPAWIRWDVAKYAFKTWLDQVPALRVLAVMILALSLALICWLAVGVIGWVINRRPHFRERIGAWLALGLVAAVITFVIMIMWDQDLGLGVIAGAILALALALALAAFCWLAWSIIWWMLSGWRHFRGRIEAVLALLVGFATIWFIGRGLFNVFFHLEPPEQVFFFLRATELASGVSVLLPALLIGLAAFLSFFAALRRLNLAERMPCLPGPQQCPGDAPQFLHFDHKHAKSFKGLKALEDHVKQMIVCRNAPGVAPAVFVILILYWLLFLHYFIPSVDGRWFDRFFKLGFFVAPLLLAWAFLRFVWLWVALRRLLRRLSWHPLISQYAARHCEEKRFASLPRVDLMTPTPTYTALSASARQARSFYDALKFTPERADTGKQIRRLVEKAERKLSDALNFDARGAWQDALKNRRDAERALADLTEHVTTLLEDSWRTSGAGPDVGWRDKGRFFLITHIMAFLQHIFAHLQNLVMLVTAGLLLLLIAANSYPFRPRESLLLFSWVAILTSVVVTLVVFVQESRDKTLSLLTGRTPGKLNFTRDFVMRVLFHGVVPLIALLGVQFPEAVRKIFTWLSVFEGKGS